MISDSIAWKGGYLILRDDKSYLLQMSVPVTIKVVRPRSLVRAFTRRDFPVPAGPYRRRQRLVELALRAEIKSKKKIETTLHPVH